MRVFVWEGFFLGQSLSHGSLSTLLSRTTSSFQVSVNCLKKDGSESGSETHVIHGQAKWLAVGTLRVLKKNLHGSLIAHAYAACRSRRSRPPVSCGACNARNAYGNLRRARPATCAAHTSRTRCVYCLSASSDPAPRRHVINGYHHHRVARSVARDPRWLSSSHA